MTPAKPFEVVAWAASTTAGSASKKLLLLTLASYADENWQCYPGQATLAEVTELGERTVRRLLAEMEADGLIRRDERRRDDGYRTSDLFTLRPPPLPAKLAADPQTSPAIHDRPHRPSTAISPATMAGQELPVEPPGRTPVVTSREQLTLVGDRSPAAPSASPAVVAGSDRDVWFAAFWEAYPRHVGKGQARTAWAKARRRGVPPERMLAAARSYAADPNREDAFTKAPANWLDGEGWDDDPVPDRRSAVPASAAGRTSTGLRQVAVTAARSFLVDPLPIGPG